MKTIKLSLFLGFLLLNLNLSAQEFQELQTINQKSVNLNSGLYVVSFWATWCGPCVKELDAINEVYEEWTDEVELQVIAISIDDARTIRRVKPMVNGKSWEFDIVLDENQDLKRRFNVINPPHSFVIKDGKILYESTGYNPGDEDYLFEQVLKIAEQ